MTSQKLRASIKSAVPVARGFLNVTRYEFEVDKHAGGSQRVVREVMERGHAVAVLAYDPVRDVVVLANEFRPGCLVAGDDPFTDNLPAGGIAEGESVVEAAVREVKEETGLELRDPLIVHPGAFVSSGGTSEKIAIVAGIVDAANAGGIYGNADESEDVRAVVIPALEFIDRVRRAEIKDMKTLVAGYWLAENRERLKALRWD
ncbi:MAG TPA: NUDIX domain-containing protein [Steroidobacteraceae bacterium]